MTDMGTLLDRDILQNKPWNEDPFSWVHASQSFVACSLCSVCNTDLGCLYTRHLPYDKGSIPTIFYRQIFCASFETSWGSRWIHGKGWIPVPISKMSVANQQKNAVRGKLAGKSSTNLKGMYGDDSLWPKLSLFVCMFCCWGILTYTAVNIR